MKQQKNKGYSKGSNVKDFTPSILKENCKIITSEIRGIYDSNQQEIQRTNIYNPEFLDEKDIDKFNIQIQQHKHTLVFNMFLKDYDLKDVKDIRDKKFTEERANNLLNYIIFFKQETNELELPNYLKTTFEYKVDNIYWESQTDVIYFNQIYSEILSSRDMNIDFLSKYKRYKLVKNNYNKINLLQIFFDKYKNKSKYSIFIDEETKFLPQTQSPFVEDETLTIRDTLENKEETETINFRKYHKVLFEYFESQPSKKSILVDVKEITETDEERKKRIENFIAKNEFITKNLSKLSRQQEKLKQQFQEIQELKSYQKISTRINIKLASNPISIWLGTCFQLILDHEIKDLNNSESIFDKIQPKENGYPVISKSGEYIVKLFYQGKYVYLKVNDLTPYFCNGYNLNSLIPETEKQEVWPVIIFKGLLKLLYPHINLISKESNSNNLLDVGNTALFYFLFGYNSIPNSKNLVKNYEIIKHLMSENQKISKQKLVICYSCDLLKEKEVHDEIKEKDYKFIINSKKKSNLSIDLNFQLLEKNEKSLKANRSFSVSNSKEIFLYKVSKYINNIPFKKKKEEEFFNLKEILNNCDHFIYKIKKKTGFFLKPLNFKISFNDIKDYNKFSVLNLFQSIIPNQNYNSKMFDKIIKQKDIINSTAVSKTIVENQINSFIYNSLKIFNKIQNSEKKNAPQQSKRSSAALSVNKNKERLIRNLVKYGLFSVNDYFNNEKFNMKSLTPLDFSDLNKKLAENTISYKTLSRSEKKIYLDKIIKIRNDIKNIKQSRISDLLDTEGDKKIYLNLHSNLFLMINDKNENIWTNSINNLASNIHRLLLKNFNKAVVASIDYVKLKEGLSNEIPAVYFIKNLKHLNMTFNNIEFSDQQIQMAKTCILSNWKIPPAEFFDSIYQEHEAIEELIKLEIFKEKSLNRKESINIKNVGKKKIKKNKEEKTEMNISKINLTFAGAASEKEKPEKWNKEQYLQLINDAQIKFDNCIEPFKNKLNCMWLDFNEVISNFKNFLVLFNIYKYKYKHFISYKINSFSIFNIKEDLEVIKFEFTLEDDKNKKYNKKEEKIEIESFNCILDNKMRSISIIFTSFSSIIPYDPTPYANYSLLDENFNLLTKINFKGFYDTFYYEGLSKSIYFLVIDSFFSPFGFSLDIYSDIQPYSISNASFLCDYRKYYSYTESLYYNSIESNSKFLIGKLELISEEDDVNFRVSYENSNKDLEKTLKIYLSTLEHQNINNNNSISELNFEKSNFKEILNNEIIKLNFKVLIIFISENSQNKIESGNLDLKILTNIPIILNKIDMVEPFQYLTQLNYSSKNSIKDFIFTPEKLKLSIGIKLLKYDKIATLDKIKNLKKPPSNPILSEFACFNKAEYKILFKLEIFNTENKKIIFTENFINEIFVFNIDVEKKIINKVNDTKKKVLGKFFEEETNNNNTYLNSLMSYNPIEINCTIVGFLENNNKQDYLTQNSVELKDSNISNFKKIDLKKALLIDFEKVDNFESKFKTLINNEENLILVTTIFGSDNCLVTKNLVKEESQSVMFGSWEQSDPGRIKVAKYSRNTFKKLVKYNKPDLERLNKVDNIFNDLKPVKINSKNNITNMINKNDILDLKLRPRKKFIVDEQYLVLNNQNTRSINNFKNIRDKNSYVNQEYKSFVDQANCKFIINKGRTVNLNDSNILELKNKNLENNFNKSLSNFRSSSLANLNNSYFSHENALIKKEEIFSSTKNFLNKSQCEYDTVYMEYTQGMFKRFEKNQSNSIEYSIRSNMIENKLEFNRNLMITQDLLYNIESNDFLKYTFPAFKTLVDKNFHHEKLKQLAKEISIKKSEIIKKEISGKINSSSIQMHLEEINRYGLVIEKDILIALEQKLSS